MTKIVLVTGSAGALGQAVVAHLRQQTQFRILETSRSGLTSLQLDVRDQERLSEVILEHAPDLVVHLAALFDGDFNDIYSVNVSAARTILDAVKVSERKTRVVLIGSAAEYGVVAHGENPVRESRVLKPVSIYGMSKAWQTQLAGVYALQGVDVVVARIFNLYGPNLSESLFIGRVQKQIQDVLAGRKSVIDIGPLSAVRDYLSTDEAADQILAIAMFGRSGSVYHVGSGVPSTMREVLDRCLVTHGLKPTIVRAAVELSNHIGYDIPAIYADVTSTMELIRLRRLSGET